jgi:hypothetical protein
LFWSIAGFLALGLAGIMVAVIVGADAALGATGEMLFMQPSAVGVKMLLL